MDSARWLNSRSLLVVALAVGFLIPSVMSSTSRAEEPRKPVDLGTIRGPDGQTISPVASRGGFAVVLFYSSECPISNAYCPTLNALVDAYPAEKVKWTGLCADPDLSDADVKAHARDFGLKLPVASDRDGTLGRKLGATMTPEAFVVDDKGAIRYHGRIDDQFAARRVRNANPSGSGLKEALSALLRGEDVKVPHVPAVGCPIPAPRAASTGPTFCKDVAPILRQNCLECHRGGQVGPFPLETYQHARKRAADIAGVVESRAMPPWKAARGVGVPFLHDRSLPERDIQTLAAWAEAGAPEGNIADLGPAPTFSDAWTLEGGPDLVVDLGVDFEVPASGPDVYRCFVVPTTLDRDAYVSGVEYRPGNRRVVHHVLAYVDTQGQAAKKDAQEPGPGYTCFSGPGVDIHGDLGGWAPGSQPSELADGIGRSLPKHAAIVIQVHYHPSGKPETDRTRIGLRFARKPVKQVLHWNGALNTELKIPPGASHHEVVASWTVPVDVVAHAVAPHMHLLGKDMKMSVKFPDGRVTELIRIDDWDFNWQYSYYFRQPLEVPKGSVVTAVAHYDNSSGNPRNPGRSKPVEVRWGEATTDEMCIGFIAVTRNGQDLTRPGEKDDLLEIFKRQEDDLHKELKPKPSS